jgi:uncharacterized membrane protein YgdD (TMEM256/DUF423 family)
VTVLPWLQGGPVKTFNVVLAVLLAVSLAWTMLQPASAERWSGLILTAGIALFAFGSIAAGHPFAEDWARERVTPEQFRHPLTRHITTTITAVWGAIYVVLAVMSWQQDRVPQKIRSTLSLVLVVGGILFSAWYPGYAVPQARG